jgi:hypothetical protein
VSQIWFTSAIETENNRENEDFDFGKEVALTLAVMSFRAVRTTRLNTPSFPRGFDPALIPPLSIPYNPPNGVVWTARLISLVAKARRPAAFWHGIESKPPSQM